MGFLSVYKRLIFLLLEELLWRRFVGGNTEYKQLTASVMQAQMPTEASDRLACTESSAVGVLLAFSRGGAFSPVTPFPSSMKVTQNDRWFRHLDTRNSACSISVFVRGLPARRAPAFLATRRDFGISLFLSQRSGTQRSNRGKAAHHTLPFISTLSPRLP
ncbi:hypothetical protein TGME49_263215 [Toxoplasma gondii ME49]|uniref:Transmembrane protein n=2 Tax=Toxoplasma gondii TaxID=5811 RepID=S8F1U7_TOXGM|nr:hypothetical protein TGME49_263215 [Toxoplasma gondii ME49]EPT29716.1 hypothetical protein TGME49_263215 [Toxoplasma gondii ME49]KYF40770.1 hypothetical protein TGARI_263215 [Toxoplasma gondii ARI]|eukprot:XP_018637153.1 hypothetical protein TGME49_263215 [Toxoplasma gondii ME49]